MSLQTSDTLLICSACGTQYSTTSDTSKTSCRICDDPRQFVPPTGQSFTTLSKLREQGYKNVFQQCKEDPKVWEIWTEPKFGIGQAARLIQTGQGNVLWDLVAFLDQDTVDKITELGGLKFIIISHPHFFTTWADWSATFSCPVYITKADSVWLNRTDFPHTSVKYLIDQHTELLPGLTAIIAGGHFEGSMMLHSAKPITTVPSLFVADTILAVPSAHNPDPAKPGVISYSFMWSIPNAIPLPPDAILQIWKAIEPYDFEATYGVFAGMSNVRWKPEHRMRLPARVLQSAKVAVKAMGYTQHELLSLEGPE